MLAAGQSTLAGREGLAIEIVASPGAVEREWRDLAEKLGSPVYQHFDWVDAFVSTAAMAQGILPAIAILRIGGRPAAIFPLGIERAGPLRIARMLGGEHANIRMPLFDPDRVDALADPLALASALVDALRRGEMRADLIDLDALPVLWNDQPVPLAAHPAARPARLPVGRLPLGADLASTLDAKRRAKKAKKHRAQVNALAPVGGYRFLRAGSTEEARRLFARFRSDKTAWFARMGIDDSFAETGVPEFFDALIERRWQTGVPLLDLYAVEFDGDIRAIFGGGAAGGRMSGYFLSVTDDEWRRITPGELLLHDLIAASCTEGYSSLDLGRGDERYKWSWLDQNEAQVRLMLPVSAAGSLALAMLRLGDVAERKLRSNEKLWRLAKAIRRRLSGREQPQAEAEASD